MAKLFGLDLDQMIGKIGDQFQKVMPDNPFPTFGGDGGNPFAGIAAALPQNPFSGIGGPATGNPFAGSVGGAGASNPFQNFGLDTSNPFGTFQTDTSNPFGSFGLDTSNPFGTFASPTNPFQDMFAGTVASRSTNQLPPTAPDGSSTPGQTGGWLGAGTSSDNASLSGEKVNQYIANGPFKSSPLAGLGQQIVEIANKYGVSAPVILAIARKESGLGTNVGAGNIFGITDPARDGGLGGQRAFQSYPNALAEVEAAARLLASDTYRGKSVQDQISMWYVGKPFDPNATDLAGNGTVQDYVDGVAEVYRALGLAPDVSSKPSQGVGGGNYPAGNWQNAGDLVKTASSLIGTPYQLGGFRTHRDNPAAGIDCSEFTSWIYGKNGYPALPENAQMQYNVTQRVAQQDLRVGDLVFFQGTYDVGNGDYITHVGMYIGNGKMINAESKGVSEADLNSPYWQQHLAGYGRIPAVGPGGRPA